MHDSSATAETHIKEGEQRTHQDFESKFQRYYTILIPIRVPKTRKPHLILANAKKGPEGIIGI